MPLWVRVSVTAVLVVAAAVFGLTAAAARAGRLRRTGFAGLHTPDAMADDASFQRANRAAAPYLAVAAAVAAVGAPLVASAVAGGGPALLLGVALVTGGAVVLGAVRGERAAGPRSISRRDAATRPPSR